MKQRMFLRSASPFRVREDSANSDTLIKLMLFSEETNKTKTKTMQLTQLYPFFDWCHEPHPQPHCRLDIIHHDMQNKNKTKTKKTNKYCTYVLLNLWKETSRLTWNGFDKSSPRQTQRHCSKKQTNKKEKKGHVCCRYGHELKLELHRLYRLKSLALLKDGCSK